MAHYAKLGINSKVIGVEVVADADCQNADGIEDEEVGRQFMERIHSWPLWKKTSYNTAGGQHKSGGTPLRGNYAGIGMTYVPTASWKSPIGDAPALSEEETLTHTYEWNESTGAWDKTAR